MNHLKLRAFFWPLTFRSVGASKSARCFSLVIWTANLFGSLIRLTLLVRFVRPGGAEVGPGTRFSAVASPLTSEQLSNMTYALRRV